MSLRQIIQGVILYFITTMLFFFRRTSLFMLLGLLGLGTTFNVPPFEETIEKTPLMVSGTVGLIYSDWRAEPQTGNRIYTFIELAVEEVIKGQLERKNIIVRELGGKKDGIGMEVSGSAHFNRGDEVVVLLNAHPNTDGSFSLRGLMMGRYDLVRDPNGDYINGPGIQMTPGIRQDSDIKVSRPSETGERWTLARIRELVQKQTGKNQSFQGEAPKDVPQGSTPNSEKGATSARSESPTNSQITQQSAESHSFPSWFIIGLGILGLGLVAIWWGRS